jgi:hypothetical protein
MSKPAFATKRREIWWSDGTSGFYVLRVAKNVWPHTAKKKKAKKCGGRRHCARKRHSAPQQGEDRP